MLSKPWLPLNSALARGGNVETAAVIAHHELQLAEYLAELDLDEVRLRVADDIRERLLRDAETGDPYGGGRPLLEGLEGKADSEPSALGLALHVLPQRSLESRLVEHGRPESLGQIAHARNRPVDQCDALGIIALEPPEVHLERAQHLPEIVVQLAGDRTTLCLLCLDQFAREYLELLRSTPQFLLRAFALGDIGVGSVRAQRPSGRIADHSGAAKEPVHIAVGPDDAELDVARSGAGVELFATAHDAAAVVGMNGGGVVLDLRAFAPVVSEEEAQIGFCVEDLPADEVVLPASGLPQLFRVDDRSRRRRIFGPASEGVR